MNLGIVGHAQEKFTSETETKARAAIHGLIRKHGATCVVSGRSPMGGVDIYAEEIAHELGLATTIHAPTRNQWSGLGGFQRRNELIAETSDIVAVIVVREFPPSFTGKKFPYCYHCKDRNPPHVKSGGCWTAWRCKGGSEWVIL